MPRILRQAARPAQVRVRSTSMPRARIELSGTIRGHPESSAIPIPFADTQIPAPATLLAVPILISSRNRMMKDADEIFIGEVTCRHFSDQGLVEDEKTRTPTILR